MQGHQYSLALLASLHNDAYARWLCGHAVDVLTVTCRPPGSTQSACAGHAPLASYRTAHSRWRTLPHTCCGVIAQH